MFVYCLKHGCQDLVQLAKENVKNFVKEAKDAGASLHLQLDIWSHKSHALLAILITGVLLQWETRKQAT